VGKHSRARGDVCGRPRAPHRGLERSFSECGILVDGARRQPPNALPRERDEALLWWCFYSDLWHSGALDEQTNTISPMLKLSSTRLVPGGYKSHGRLPSAVQAGIAKYVSREPDKN